MQETYRCLRRFVIPFAGVPVRVVRGDAPFKASAEHFQNDGHCATVRIGAAQNSRAQWHAEHLNKSKQELYKVCPDAGADGRAVRGAGTRSGYFFWEVSRILPNSCSVSFIGMSALVFFSELEKD